MLKICQTTQKIDKNAWKFVKIEQKYWKKKPSHQKFVKNLIKMGKKRIKWIPKSWKKYLKLTKNIKIIVKHRWRISKCFINIDGNWYKLQKKIIGNHQKFDENWKKWVKSAKNW